MQILYSANLIDPQKAAKYLLGCEIWRTLPSGEVLKARIVETESYHQDDPASHTFRGETKRNKAMFGPAGFAYIYFTYGRHWCFNITAGEVGYGAGVLIRAVEPLEGIEAMKKFRNIDDIKQLTNGPAKLAQALAIDNTLYGHNLTKPPLQVYKPKNKKFETVETTRIGISLAVDEVARFYIKNNIFVSKK